jgi:hypothetical protein
MAKATIESKIIKVLEESAGTVSVRLFNGLLKEKIGRPQYSEVYAAINKLIDEGRMVREDREGFDCGVYVLKTMPK